VTLVSLYLTHPALVWLGAGAVLLGVEILSGSGWLLWAAASAGLTAAVVAASGDLSLTAALGGFALLTIASTLLARRYLPRSAATSGDINDNAARLVGHHGRAVAGFDGGAGRVFIDGKEWAALVDGDAAPAAGAQVLVTGVAGARLKVRPAP
jgi:membrane protein implicated in regulation of membrane protease activity